jgi:hypothetical protein
MNQRFLTFYHQDLFKPGIHGKLHFVSGDGEAETADICVYAAAFSVPQACYR